jgi:hypothetical protein
MKKNGRRSFLVDAAGVAATAVLAISSGGLFSMLLSACKSSEPFVKYGGPPVTPTAPDAVDSSDPAIATTKYGGPPQQFAQPPAPEPSADPGPVVKYGGPPDSPPDPAPTTAPTSTTRPPQNRPKYGGPPVNVTTKYGGRPVAKYGGPSDF